MSDNKENYTPTEGMPADRMSALPAAGPEGETTAMKAGKTPSDPPCSAPPEDPAKEPVRKAERPDIADVGETVPGKNSAGIDENEPETTISDVSKGAAQAAPEKAIEPAEIAEQAESAEVADRAETAPTQLNGPKASEKSESEQEARKKTPATRKKAVAPKKDDRPLSKKANRRKSRKQAAENPKSAVGQPSGAAPGGNENAGTPSEYLSKKHLSDQIAKVQAIPVEQRADDEELSSEERERVETITRTAQLSIEKILEGAALRSGTGGDEATMDGGITGMEQVPPESAAPRSFGRKVANFLLGLLQRFAKWLLLVAVFVALIAIVGVAWLYKNATPEAIPQFSASFGGQTLETASSAWHVPVVGKMIRRTYKETSGTKIEQLPETVGDAKPAFVVSPAGYSTEITIRDSDKKEIFTGTMEEYDTFTFETNGSYTADLTISNEDEGLDGTTLVVGSQQYHFAFNVDIKPTIRLNNDSVQQGGVVAVRVTGMPEDSNGQPALKSDITEGNFVRAPNGWVAFLPIDRNQEIGSYNIQVEAGNYTENMSLIVRARNWGYKDYGSQSQMVSPYIGVDSTPEQVRKVLNVCDPQIYWSATGFVQPFLTNIDIKLDFGTAEYVGRTRIQKANNTNVNGRIATNTVVTCTPNQDLIAPADGRVLLAEDLGGTAGKTIVIEHGAGIKSIFYNFSEISVEEGQNVLQGQAIGKTNKIMIGEVRIGEKPIDPLVIWRGQCEAVKYL